MTQRTPDDLWRDFPKTATEFEKRFATEGDCRTYWIRGALPRLRPIRPAAEPALESRPATWAASSPGLAGSDRQRPGGPSVWRNGIWEVGMDLLHPRHCLTGWEV
jgi:hypothetical protein